MIHPARIWIAAAAFLAAFPVASDEVVFGGEVTFETAAAYQAPAALSLRASAAFSPQVSVFSDVSEFRAVGRFNLAYPTPGETISLERLQLRLFPLEWLSVDMGLLTRTTGASVLLSPVDFIAPLDMRLSSGGLPSTAGSQLLLGINAFVGPAYVSAYVAPAPRTFRLPEIDSISGSIGFLSVIDDPDVGPALDRASLDLAATEGLADPAGRLSIQAEAGIPVGPIDVTATYYHGIDRIPTIGLTVVPDLADSTFDLTATPVESSIEGLGISIETAAGPASFWVDGAYVFSRLFGTIDFVPAGAGIYQNTTIAAASLELAAGGLVLIDPGLTFLLEYRHGFLGSDRQDIIRLDFPGTALASVAGDLGPVTLSVAGVVLIPDPSAAIVGSVRISPSSEIEAFIRVPVFLGGAASVLGGLSWRYAASGGVTYRF